MVKLTNTIKIITIIAFIGVFVVPNNSYAFWNMFSTSKKSSIISFIGDGFLKRETKDNSIEIISGKFLISGVSYGIGEKEDNNAPKNYRWVTATAYSSTVDQTDDTPFITASGTHVRSGVVAANFLPFGSLIKIPELYGNKIFIVEDRMNKRYQNRVDIWFPTREEAKQFGVKTIKIEIL